MSQNNTAEYLLVGLESFQNETYTNDTRSFHSLNDILTYVREMNFQKDYFDILDIKAGKQVNWAELN